MNNNLYHWQDERLVELKLPEVDREVQQARLLKEVGLSGESWLAHAAQTLRNLLKARNKGTQGQRSVEPSI